MNGALSLRESPRPIELGDGINEDIELVGETPYSQYIIEGPATAFSIDGIKFVDYADGQIVRLINTTDQVMTIVHNNGDGLKIVCPSEKNLVVGGKNSSVTLQYSKGLRKWTVFGYTSKNINNKYSSLGAPIEDYKNNTTWSDLKGMELNFTPVNDIIYVTYAAYGDVINSIFQKTKGHFRLVMNSSVVKNTEIITPELNNKNVYHALLPMFPLSFTPGTPVTLKIQWKREESGTIYNNPYYDSHGRYITVID